MKLKILFFPIALFVAFMVTIFFTKPEWDIYSAKQEELSQLTNELDDLKSGFNLIKNATKKLENLNPDQESLVQNAIPDLENDDNFLAEIHKSAERSGVFIVSTKVKNAKLTRTGTPGVVPIITKPVLQSVEAKITVMGAYIDIAEFIKEVDSHNRLTTPRELMIIGQDGTTEAPVVESEEVQTVINATVKGEVTFKFYKKVKNDKLQIASLIRASDPVIKSLLNGQFKTGIIENYQDKVTREVFRPIGAGSAGKVDIFSKE